MYRRVKRNANNLNFFLCLHPSIHSTTFHFVEHSGRADKIIKLLMLLIIAAMPIYVFLLYQEHEEPQLFHQGHLPSRNLIF